MTLVSLSLITMWMALVLLGVTLAGFVHVLLVAAAAIVFLSGNRGIRRTLDAASLGPHARVTR